MAVKRMGKSVILSIIILLFISILLTGCTDKIKYSVEHLSFSHDGSKLISVTYPNSGVYYETDTERSSGLDIQVWDIISNEIIWTQQYPEGFYSDAYDNIYLSPDGRYISTFYGYYDILLNTSAESDCSLQRTTNEEFYVIKNSSSSIDVYNHLNCSKIKTITFNMSIESYPTIVSSPNGLEVAILFENASSISLVETPSEKIITLENTSLNFSKEISKYHDQASYDNYRYKAYRDNKISWSNDGKKIALTFIEYNGIKSQTDYGRSIGLYSCHIFIWERGSGLLLDEIELIISNIYDFENEEDKIDLPILSSNFEYYGYAHIPRSVSNEKNYGSYELGSFKIFNRTNHENIINLKAGKGQNIICDWSNDQKIALGNEVGNIYIYNATTGKEISILQTPYHTIAAPCFELLLLICAAAVIIIWKRKK